jgi:hypothetical protein
MISEKPTLTRTRDGEATAIAVPLRRTTIVPVREIRLGRQYLPCTTASTLQTPISSTDENVSRDGTYKEALQTGQLRFRPVHSAMQAVQNVCPQAVCVRASLVGGAVSKQIEHCDAGSSIMPGLQTLGLVSLCPG